MAATIDLKWKNDGDWDGLMRGGITKASTCMVGKTIISGSEAVVYIQSHDGDINEGDAVQNGICYYSVIAVDKTGDTINSFTLAIDSRFVAFQVNTQLIILKPKEPAEQDLSLETVLNQLGAYTYLVQYIYNNSVNLRDVNAIPPRFYYPTKHTSITGFLELIGQTLRAYWDFPDVVTGLDGFPVFIPQLIQVSGVKMWQWVDKKLGYVLSVDEENKTIKTRPVMQLPCKAILGGQVFAIAKSLGQQKYQLALEPDLNSSYQGDLIRCFTTAESMDWWDLPTDPIQAECQTLDVVNDRVRVRFQSGEFYTDDILYEVENPEQVYTVTKVEVAGATYSLYLNPIPPAWPQGTLLRKVEPDVRVPGKRANPLIQKATATYLSYEQKPSIRMFVIDGELNWISAQTSRGTPVVGDVFHKVDETDLYTITKVEGDHFYFEPTSPVAFSNSEELEIVQSTMDLSCGIQIPAYGEYYLSMTNTPSLYKNATFRIVGRDPDTLDLKYDEGANWSPYDVARNAFCTKNIYKLGDYCYNGTTFPRTMEHLTQLLYEYYRLITAMWDQIQITGIYLTNNQTMEEWIGSATDHLQADPYWKLYFEGF